MEAVTIWFNIWIGVAILALNLRVQAAAIIQDQSILKRRLYQAVFGCIGAGIICMLVGALYSCIGLYPWTWVTVGFVFIISVAVPLLVKLKTGGLTGGGSKESGKKLDSAAVRLMVAAVSIILVSFIVVLILQQLGILS
jgi:hypothetical protein